MVPVKTNSNWLPSIFNDFFENEWLAKTGVTAPAINVIENDKDYKVEMAAPGMTKDEFKVNVDENNNLTICMEKKEEKKEEQKASVPEGTVSMIDIAQFKTVSLRVGHILTAEKVEKADKLLKFTVDLGTEQRTIVSGIAKYYTPEEMVGKQVVVVANLKPAKLRGIESQGMLLCAVSADGDVVLVSPEKRVPAGSEVC